MAIDVRARIDAEVDGFIRGMNAARGRLREFGSELSALGSRAPGRLGAMNQAVQAINPGLQRWSTNMMAVGAATVAAYSMAEQKLGAWADKIGDVANATGLTTDKVQALDRILKRADLDLNTFAMASGGVARALEQAGKAGTPAAEALKRLGIDLRELKAPGRDTADQLAILSERLSQVADSRERLALSQDLGISARAQKILGAGLSPEALRKELDSPFQITQEQTKAAAELSTELDHLSTNAEYTFLKVMAASAKPATELVQQLNGLLEKVAAFVDKNPELVGNLITAGVRFAGLNFVVGNGVKAFGPTLNVVTKLAGWLGRLGGAGGAAAAGAEAAGSAAAAASGGGLAGLGSTLAGLGVTAGGAAVVVGLVVASLAALYFGAKDLIALYESAKASLDAAKTELQTDAIIDRMGQQGRFAEGGQEAMTRTTWDRWTPWDTKHEREMETRGPAAFMNWSPKVAAKYGGDPTKSRKYTGPRGADVIPAMAAGGIVARPTFAMVGEAGPEAVVPLTQFWAQLQAALGQLLGPALGGVAGGRGLAAWLQGRGGGMAAHRLAALGPSVDAIGTPSLSLQQYHLQRQRIVRRGYDTPTGAYEGRDPRIRPGRGGDLTINVNVPDSATRRGIEREAQHLADRVATQLYG